MDFNAAEVAILMGQSPLLTAILDHQGIMLKVNERWSSQFNLPLDEMVGQPIFNLVARHDREMVREVYQDLFVEKRLAYHQFRFVDYQYNVRAFAFYLSYENDRIYLSAMLVTRDDKEHRALNTMSRVASIGAWYYDPKRDEEFWSVECYRIHDLDPRTVVNKDLSLAFYEPEYREQLNSLMQRLFDHHQGYDFIGRLTTPAGATKWIRTIARPVVHHGNLIYVNGSCSDVTERQNLIEDLRRSEETQRLALKGIRSGVFDFHVEEDKLIFGSDFKDMLGIEPGENWLDQNDFHSMVHPDDNDRAKGIQEHIFKGTGHHYFNQYRIRNRSGEYRHYEIYGWIKRNTSGQAIRMVGNLIDVEDKVVAERDRQKYMARLEAVIRNGFVNSYLLSREGNIIQADQSAIPVLQAEYPLPDVIEGEVHYSTILPEEFTAIFELEFSEALQGRSLRVEQHRQLQTGKDIWLDVMYKPVKESGTDIGSILINIMDITDRKRAEAQTRKARKKMDDFNKFKFNILASLSHEIRTPLNGIMGSIHLLRNEVSNQDKQELLDAQQISADRLLRMLNNIISLSDLESDKPEITHEEVIISELMQSSEREFSLRAQQKSLGFRMQNDAGDLRFRSNTALISTALGHLLDNAIKYTNKGTISLHALVKDEGKLVIEVEDTGIGIENESLDRVFEMFVQEGTGKTWNLDGTGIGLSLALRFIQLLDGRIEVESETGKGSVFRIVLPLRPEKVAHAVA